MPALPAENEGPVRARTGRQCRAILPRRPPDHIESATSGGAGSGDGEGSGSGDSDGDFRHGAGDGDAPQGRSPVFGANVLLLVYGDAFWPTYTTGDNTDLVATDSMKNFIQRETLTFSGYDLEEYCRFLAERFTTRYPQVEGARVSASEVPNCDRRPRG